MNQAVEKRLNHLIQLEVDVCFSYQHALKDIKHDEIHNRLSDYKADHEGHIKTLSNCLLELGGTPIQYTQDFRGYVVQGMMIDRNKGCIKSDPHK